MLKQLHSTADKQHLLWFAFFCLICISAAVLLYNPAPLVAPPALLFILFTLNNPRYLFYLFFATLPFSVEIELGSLATDLPSEPMMLVLMGLTIVLSIYKSHSLGRGFLHPISCLIILHLSWIAFTAFGSTDTLVSFKYFLAKTWYVLPFYFFPMLVMKSEHDFRKVFSLMTASMFVAMGYVLFNHAGEGFSFDSATTIVKPIFRNHVNYAIMLLAFVPYFWYLITTSPKKRPWFLYFLMLLLFVGIYFSYTRAAQASVLLAIIFYWVVRLRLVKICMGIALVAFTVLTIFVSVGNKYLDFAPSFENTVAHTKFDNLLEATTKMEDISTVERFYRWVAGAYMIQEKPFMGYGPGTFYFQYHAYTVTSYRTYVSDNPEKSGIHNNYLMVAVEQGIPGFIIMFLLVCLPLLYAEQVYHKLVDRHEKNLVMAAGICFFVIAVVILINDLLEADKIGPFFFLSASIIVFFSSRKEEMLPGPSARAKQL